MLQAPDRMFDRQHRFADFLTDFRGGSRALDRAIADLPSDSDADHEDNFAILLQADAGADGEAELSMCDL
jgi:hypothetical protein